MSNELRYRSITARIKRSNAAAIGIVVGALIAGTILAVTSSGEEQDTNNTSGVVVTTPDTTTPVGPNEDIPNPLTATDDLAAAFNCANETLALDPTWDPSAPDANTKFVATFSACASIFNND